MCEAENLLIYHDFRTEVITGDFIRELIREGKKKVFLPKVNGPVMDFYEVKDPKDLEAGYKGIREPSGKDGSLLYRGEPEETKSVCIVPGSVFDRTCGRMGYGKGYYDRFLGEHPGLFRIGVAFEAQISDTLIPREEHDVIMDLVVTEKRIITSSERRIR